MAVVELNTASSVISFARELEEKSSRFYEELARLFPQDETTYQKYVKDNRKYISQFETAYYSVISDAIEGCFAFKIKPEEYDFDTGIETGLEESKAVERAMAMEDMMCRFYTDAAEQSKSLMADVPRVFSLIARKRTERKQQLESKR